MRPPSNASGEREPLLGDDGQSSSESESSVSTKNTWLSFTTISPKYRWLPFVGCAIIFTNEAEYFIKQVATMRALEAMYCYEYYAAQGSPLVEMGKHIPERLCKIDSVQKSLATTAGLIMFVRMLSAMFGAVPLGWVADRWGRKPVVVLHKINVMISTTLWLVLCNTSLLLQSE